MVINLNMNYTEGTIIGGSYFGATGSVVTSLDSQ